MSNLSSEDRNEANSASYTLTARKKSIVVESIREAVENYLAEEESPSSDIGSQQALFNLKEVLDALRKVESPKDLEETLAKRLIEQYPNDLKLIKVCGNSYILMYLAILKEIRDIQESVDEQGQTSFYKMGGKKSITKLIAILENELDSNMFK